jgi:ribonuclease D
VSELERLAARAREEGRLGIDTEFMPEGRYRPLLCLVQVCVGEEVVVLDPMNGDLDGPAPLAAVLADPAVEVVLHAGRQDVAILRRAWGTTFANVFDTQVAAGFAGFSAQAGYTGLLHDVLQIRLSKSASFTRWDARPLTPEQLRYAREDVEHLLPLADELQRRLTERGRLEWAREECLAIAEATDERDPEEAWRRLPRISGLDPRGRALARELAAWRERTAAAEDRPVGSVVRDPTLVELAKRAPVSTKELSQIRGAGPDVVRRRARDLIAAVERGLAAPPIRLEEGERLSTDPVDGPTIALAEALVRARAQEAGLAYELIAARADLAPIVVAARRSKPEPDVRTLRGWRRELVGAELLELLAGNRSLGVLNGRVDVG